MRLKRGIEIDCLLRRLSKLLSILALMSISAQAAETINAANVRRELELCTSSEKIDLNPFRKIERQEFGYLSLMLRPMITHQPSTESILEAWAFEQNGKVFTGKIRQDAVWNDGSKINAPDVAYSIAMQLPFREIGEKISIQGVNQGRKNTKKTVEQNGIEIINERTFKIRLKSSIENAQGILREALTEGARGNRLWPMKGAASISIHRAKRINSAFATRYPTSEVGSKILLHFNKNYAIRMLPKTKCVAPDLADSSILILGNQREYSSTESNSKQALIAFIPSRNELSETEVRSELVGWIRSIMPLNNEGDHFETPKAHFLENEPGSGAQIIWKNSSTHFPKNLPNPLRIFIFSKNTKQNIFGKSIENALLKADKSVEWITDIDHLNNAHIALSPTKITEGRQTWFQDLSTSHNLVNFLKGHQKTIIALKSITEKSSSTVPTDNFTLKQLELSAFKERSIAPILRFDLKLYSRKSSPLTLEWTSTDEWSLRRR